MTGRSTGFAITKPSRTPEPPEIFDAQALIAEQGSRYLVAGEPQAALAGPLLTALVECWLTTAQDVWIARPTAPAGHQRWAGG